MSSFTALHECRNCDAMFKEKGALESHRKDCKSKAKLHSHSPHDFTRESASHSLSRLSKEAISKVVPDTVKSGKFVEPKDTFSATDSLLRAVAGEMKKPKLGLETSILSAIAEGDDELADMYKTLSIDPSTGTKKLTKEIAVLVTKKTRTGVAKIAKLIIAAQVVSLCFLLDTTGSMQRYITEVKSQIVQIVRQVKASGCEIAGLAFIGYKDWCDGKPI
jgi:hypothetical protein